MRIAALIFAVSLSVSVRADWEVKQPIFKTGTIGGGDVITIETTYKPDGLCDPFPCGAFPRVLFGDVPARDATTDTSTGTVTVITPAHAAGTVQVTLDFDGIEKPVGKFLFLDRRSALNYENYEEVLVPVAVGGAPAPGANGSLWTSELWVSNSGAHRVEVMQGLPPVCSTCVDEPYPGVDAGETKKIELPAGAANAAYRLYVQRGGIDDLTFSLRIRDVSQSDDNHGTEIPVVRQSEFARVATVVNVPIDSRSRTALRIYSSAGHVQQLDVRVDFYPVASREKVASTVITLRNPAATTGDRPTYFEYGVSTNLNQLLAEAPSGNYRLEVTAVDPVLVHDLYALASVTNNRTQLVTAIASE